MSANTVMGSSPAPAPSSSVRTGSPNSMIHLLGSGTSPIIPSHGKVGVRGK